MNTLEPQIADANKKQLGVLREVLEVSDADYPDQKAISDYMQDNKTECALKIFSNDKDVKKICAFANRIFPEHAATNSGQTETTNHDGVFLVREQDVDCYFAEYSCCVQLRDKVTETRIKNQYDAINFGNSKGLSFGRILIYPTKPIMDWIKNNNSDLKPTSRSKFYVAVTRARYSVGIVYNYSDDEVIEGTEKFQLNVAEV